MYKSLNYKNNVHLLLYGDFSPLIIRAEIKRKSIQTSNTTETI